MMSIMNSEFSDSSVFQSKEQQSKYMTERQRIEKTQKDVKAIHDELRALKELFLSAFKAK